MTKIVKFYIILGLLLAGFLPAGAQKIHYSISPRNAERVLTQEHIRASVDWLCQADLGGRATGTSGAFKTAVWLSNQFRSLGLEPLGGAWFHGFDTSAGMGRNVIGFLPGSGERYVIVMAHYDNLGTLAGTLYPGADSNASGVATLVELAGMFVHMKGCRKTYTRNLILVGLDAKEKDLAGSADLWRRLSDGKLLNPATGKPVDPSQVELVVNLDQLGATLSPLTKGQPNYLMMLSDPSTGRRSQLESANLAQHLEMEIGYDYYGSKDFTRLFYENVSDQRVFLEHGIPAVMFTSGITFNNNKPSDTPETLDYAVLRRRIQLIFYWLDKVL